MNIIAFNSSVKVLELFFFFISAFIGLVCIFPNFARVFQVLIGLSIVITDCDLNEFQSLSWSSQF